MRSEQPLVAVTVPVFNRLEITRRFVAAFRTWDYERKLLVICDDGSTDGSGEFLEAQSDVITVKGDGSLWWSGGTNAAIEEALRHQPDYILTINDDGVQSADFLRALVSEAARHPRTIIGSNVLQLQSPERHWAVGVSYLNYGMTPSLCDCFGAPVHHVSQLASSSVLCDTLAGNGVLYPVEVFDRAGFFDKDWTPHYHGDTLLVHRAARKGFASRVQLQAKVFNDMTGHGVFRKGDPILSKSSVYYAPAIYKTVEELEGETAALDFLGGILASVRSDFCPESRPVWKKWQQHQAPLDFEVQPYLMHTLAAGKFVPMGYRSSPGLQVQVSHRHSHHEIEIEGEGVLTLVLRVRQTCRFTVFIVTDKAPEHLSPLAQCHQRGSEAMGGEWLTWFKMEGEAADFARIPLAVVSRGVEWRGIYLMAEENVAAAFRD
jgi:N-acetylglucosaminyl-diphospho-decaprenol L-rhamnosyltransferase